MASERGSRKKEIGKKAARIVLSACVWLAAWQVLSSVVGKEVLFASPYATFTRLFSLLGTGDFWLKTLRSLLGITEGYLLGICGGVLLAVLTACSEWLYVVFKPMLTVIKTTPVVSFIILALVWLQKESVPIFISFLMVLPVVYINCLQGILGVDSGLLEMARASDVCVAVDTENVPLLPQALEYARLGFIPSGSHANRLYCAAATEHAAPLDEALESLIFDAQTSGGLVLAVPPDLVEQVSAELLAAGDLAADIGEVLPSPSPTGSLLLR